MLIIKKYIKYHVETNNKQWLATDSTQNPPQQHTDAFRWWLFVAGSRSQHRLDWIFKEKQILAQGWTCTNTSHKHLTAELENHRQKQALGENQDWVAVSFACQAILCVWESNYGEKSIGHCQTPFFAVQTVNDLAMYHHFSFVSSPSHEKKTTNSVDFNWSKRAVGS